LITTTPPRLTAFRLSAQVTAPNVVDDRISAARQLIAVAEYPVGAEAFGDRGTLVIARRDPHLEAGSTTHLNERSRHAA
jgi:hypothetical protein